MIRSTLDALTTAGAYEDDVRVDATKVHATGSTGAIITITPCR